KTDQRDAPGENACDDAYQAFETVPSNCEIFQPFSSLSRELARHGQPIHESSISTGPPSHPERRADICPRRLSRTLTVSPESRGVEHVPSSAQRTPARESARESSR